MTEAIFSILQRSSLSDSLALFKANQEFDKWLVLSDYTHQRDAHTHETYCFSILPVFFPFEGLRSAIADLQPTDLKKTQRVNADFLRLVASDQFLHFVFSFGRDKQTPLRGSTIESSRETIRELRDYVTQNDALNFDNPAFGELKKRVALVEQKSNKAGFNYILFDKMIIISCVAAILASWITKYTAAREINWMSDRDNTTTYCDGIIYDLFSMSYSGSIDRINAGRQAQLWTSHEDANGTMWFDELIRIPDFLAGAFSRVSLATGSVGAGKQAHIVRKVMHRVHFFTIKKEDDDLVLRRERLGT
jgi:hypothetical protein